MKKEPLVLGNFTFSVLIQGQDELSEAQRFLDDLKKKNFDEFRKIITRLKRWAEFGAIPNNREQFVLEEDGIYAIKSFQVRLYGFMGDRQEFIITNGTIKKSDRANQADLEKSKRFRALYKGDI